MSERVLGTITFHDDGTAGAIYSDAIAEYLRDLAPGGRIVVQRVSHVEFDDDLQGWTVRVTGGYLCAGDRGTSRVRAWPCCAFATREAALAAEVEFLREVI